MNTHQIISTMVGNDDIARHVLRKYPTMSHLLHARVGDLTAIYGVGTVAARRLIAAANAGRFTEMPEEKPGIHSPADAAAYVTYEMSGMDHEELWVMLLNTRNRMIEIVHVYKGSLNSAQVRVGELFKVAIRANAASIILFHNHPSNDPTPSPDDVALTRSVVEAGRLLDIEVLDHMVISSGRFVSLKERKLGFS